MKNNNRNNIFFFRKLTFLSPLRVIATTITICFSLVFCNSQNNNMVCNTVPDEIDKSHFVKAEKKDFVYIGQIGQRTLLSDLIKHKCITPRSSKVFMVFAGDLIFDTKYDFEKGTELIALESAQIIVESDISFSDSYLHSCGKSWLGMNMFKPKATLDIDKKTKIEDTDRAIGIDLSN